MLSATKPPTFSASAERMACCVPSDAGLGPPPHELHAKQTRDALGDPVHVDVAQELQAALQQQDGEIQPAIGQQQLDGGVGHGIVAVPPLHPKRPRGGRKARQREQAEPDLLLAPHLEDVAVKRRRHSPAGPIAHRWERPPVEPRQRRRRGPLETAGRVQKRRRIVHAVCPIARFWSEAGPGRIDGEATRPTQAGPQGPR